MPVHSVLWGQMTASYCEPGPLATVCTPLALWGPQEAPHRPMIHLLQGPSPRENRSLLLPRALWLLWPGPQSHLFRASG